MAINCSTSALVAASKCYLEQCTSEAERDALEIYFRARGLAGAGGTNYTTVRSLLAAAKEWQGFSMKQLEAIDTYISLLNANTNGAALSTNINTLKTAASCYLCIPEATRKQVLMFLRCALNNLNVGD